MSVQLARRPFTTAEYHRLIEIGLLTEDDRVELLNGEIIEMAPIGPRHAACVKRVSEFLHSKVKKAAIVGTQDPIELNDFSEPEPDLSLLKRRADFYAESHPTPADVLIAIEVADTSVEKDREIKLPSYARSGIPEAWLIDLYNDRIEIHYEPHQAVYQQVRIVQRGQRFASPTLPQLKFKAEDILG
jgi:Uma2 family endonuclease